MTADAPELLPDPVFFQSLPTLIASSAVILRDEHGRVVIENPNYRDHWLLPGGCLDAGEDPRTTARREVREELGLDIEVGRLLSVDWGASDPVSGRPMGLHFLFDGGTVPAARLEAEVVPQASELDGWMLADESQIALLGAHGAARVLHALAVLRGEERPELHVEGN